MRKTAYVLFALGSIFFFKPADATPFPFSRIDKEYRKIYSIELVRDTVPNREEISAQNNKGSKKADSAPDNPLYNEGGSEGSNPLYNGMKAHGNGKDTIIILKPKTILSFNLPNSSSDDSSQALVQSNTDRVVNSKEYIDDWETISIVTNPIYSSGHTSGENPLYERKSRSVKGNSNNSYGDSSSIPDKQEAQDYNSTRSNKIYGNVYVVNINSNDNSNSSSVPDKQEAQDYNSTRSNKCSGHTFVVNINSNDNNNDSIPDKQEAQDYNSTRSNKRSGHTFVVNINSNDNNRDSIYERQEAQDFNTTRSNRQNSNYSQKIGGSNPDSNGKTPVRQEAQDFNTTRSNRQNSNYSQKIGGSNPDSNGKAPVRQEAQDFNTTRSNRQNSNYSQKIGGSNPDSNGKAPARQEAQDFNTTRSNRQNSNYVLINVGNNPLNSNDSFAIHVHSRSNNRNTRINIQNNSNHDLSVRLKKSSDESYNPWEMDDNVEGTVMNLLYESEGNSGNNPIYENANNNRKAGGNNGNTSAPSRQEAQDYNSTRSNKANCLTLGEGGSFGNGAHTKNGMNFSIGFIAPATKILSVEANAIYNSIKFKLDGTAPLPERYVSSMEKSLQSNPWRAFSLLAGPALQIGQKKLNATLYAKAGITFIKIPQQFVGAIDEKGNITDQSGLAKFSGNKTTFSYQAGVRINYGISRNCDLFIHPHYFSTLNDLPYTEKNVDKSLGADRQFNPDMFGTLPFENKKDKLQMIGINLGIKIRLKK